MSNEDLIIKGEPDWHIKHNNLVEKQETDKSNILNELESHSTQLSDMTNVKFENENALAITELVDSTGWIVPIGWTGDFVSGFVNTVGNTNSLTRTMISTGTKKYLVKFRVESPTLAGNPNASTDFTVSLGNSLSFITYKGGGNFDYNFGIQSVSDGNLVFTPGVTFDGTIKNISVKEIIEPTEPTYVIKDSSLLNAFELRPGNNTLNNVFLGVNSGKYTVEGDNNVGLGADTLLNNTTGYWNTALGSKALEKNTVGSRCIALGYLSQNANISGDRNISIGTFSLYRNTTGRENIAMGADNMWYNTIGSNNIALGHYAMGSNVSGNFNIALGNASLNEGVSGSYNIAIGVDAMLRNVSGLQNIAIGRDCMKNITTNSNIAIGTGAMNSTTTGTFNTAIGNSAFSSNVAGSNNTVVGNTAGQGTSGNINKNVLVGEKTGYILTTGGNNNTVLGTYAGQNLTIGNNNIIIGYNVQSTSATSSGDVNIGNLFRGNLYTKKATIGDSIINPGATLHLPAGTSTAGGAPIKINSGSLLTTPELGAIEYDGVNLYFTPSSGVRKTLAVVA